MSKKKDKDLDSPADEKRDTEVTDEGEKEEAADKAPEDDYTGAERRKFRRVKVKLHMIYEDGKTGVKTNVVNISMGGAFLEMPKPPKEGAEIRLTPIFPEKTPDTPEVQLKGRVVRVVEYNLPDMGKRMGVGVKFTNLAGEEGNILSDIFRKNVDESKTEEEEKEEEEEKKQDESSKTGEWNPPGEL